MAFNYSPKVVTDGLVLYLDAANPNSYVSGSNTWRDISRGGNNGTLVNGPTYSSANGGSIVFDGSNDYVNLSNFSGIITNNFTYITFVNISSLQFDINTLLCNSNYGATNGFRIYLNNYQTTDRSIALEVYTNTYYNVGSANMFNNNEWFMVSVVVDRANSNAIVYKNNTIIASGSIPNNFNLNNNQWRIGAASPTPIFFGRYSMPISYIYNRTLTALEIQQNYNALKGRFGLT
jgi:hypothetical protein